MQKSSKQRTPNTTATAEAQRTRGRPREFDRALALARVTRVFWQKGYEATSISDLTKALEISAPSLYAAFGSKEALYAEALQYYAETYKSYVWGRFATAETARESVMCFLLDSAAALTGGVADIPRGCMVTLSAVGSEGYPELGELVRSARAVTLERLKDRIQRAVEAGEIPATIDVPALARFVQTVQYGMSILARDRASHEDLEDVAQTAMLGWDARTGIGSRGRPAFSQFDY